MTMGTHPLEADIIDYLSNKGMYEKDKNFYLGEESQQCLVTIKSITAEELIEVKLRCLKRNLAVDDVHPPRREINVKKGALHSLNLIIKEITATRDDINSIKEFADKNKLGISSKITDIYYGETQQVGLRYSIYASKVIIDLERDCTAVTEFCDSLRNKEIKTVHTNILSRHQTL